MTSRNIFLSREYVQYLRDTFVRVAEELSSVSPNAVASLRSSFSLPENVDNTTDVFFAATYDLTTTFLPCIVHIVKSLQHRVDRIAIYRVGE